MCWCFFWMGCLVDCSCCLWRFLIGLCCVIGWIWLCLDCGVFCVVCSLKMVWEFCCWFWMRFVICCLGLIRNLCWRCEFGRFWIIFWMRVCWRMLVERGFWRLYCVFIWYLMSYRRLWGLVVLDVSLGVIWGFGVVGSEEMLLVVFYGGRGWLVMECEVLVVCVYVFIVDDEV